MDPMPDVIKPIRPRILGSLLAEPSSCLRTTQHDSDLMTPNFISPPTVNRGFI